MVIGPSIVCGNCAGRIDLPAGFAKAKVRCPHCGYYAEVPVEQRGAAVPPVEERRTDGGDKPRRSPEKKPVARARRSVDPRDHRPQFEADEPAGPPLLEGTRDHDDDQPYAVPGTGTRKCPHCRGELPLDASLCVHCGRDIASGERTTRSFQPILREWVEGWSFKSRVQLFGGAQVLNALIAVRILALGDEIGLYEVFWTGVFIGIHVALQAFIIGSFDTLTLRRNQKGAATLTRLRRIGFVKVSDEKLNWKESHAIGIAATHGVGCFTWAVCVYLVLLGVVPGLIFYWMVIHPERYEVVQCDVYGSTTGVVFRSTDREQADEAARVIADATGPLHKRVL